MAPTIHCVRHAQGFHNLSIAAHSILDPLLTPLGEQQCRDLADRFPYHDRVDLVVASPLRRTLYTALHGFGGDIARRNLRVIALPELQETSDLPCDTGNSPEFLANEFADLPVDLSNVPAGWNSKRGKWSSAANAIERRAQDVRLWLLARPEQDIVVVTHGALLHYLTEDWAGSDRFAGTGWSNTEMRSYTFSSYDLTDAHLVETTASLQRRGLLALAPPAEQALLKKKSIEDWVKAGYISNAVPVPAVQASAGPEAPAVQGAVPAIAVVGS